MPITSILEAVEAARSRIENLSVTDLQAERANDPDLLLIDIRELQERLLRGAIPGSEHAPRGMLEFWADPALSYFRDWFRPERRIVLYCAGGGRSSLATVALTDMGYENVAHLAVGFNGWREAGGDVEDVASTSRWVRRD